MDAESAIQAHRAWKDRLRTAMATRQPLNVEEIGTDRCCDFGKWLYGEGRIRFGSTSLYEKCVAMHAQFHAAAADVAALVNKGQLRDADKMLAHGTPYSKASADLVVGVTAMFNADKSPQDRF